MPKNFDRGPDDQLIREQRIAEDRELTEKAAKADPDDPLAHQLLGWFAREARGLPAARRAFERCLALEPKSASGLSDLANTYMYDGSENAPRAVQLLDQAAALQVNRPRDTVQLNLGEARFSAGDSAGAVGPLRMALQISAGVDEALLYLAMAYADLGDQEQLRQVPAQLAQIDWARTAKAKHELFFASFEPSNSVDTPAYRVYRDTRVLPQWRKAGLPPRFKPCPLCALAG